jgi:hypothetical protein
MDLTPYFEKALNTEEYIGLLAENLELHQLHYKKFQMTQADEDQLKKVKPLKILVLTEPWCGDSVAIFPVVRKMAEVCQWPVKILRRDENLDLMDQFLTGNARAVPIFLFLNPDHTLIFRFGPRPEAAQAIFEQYREEFKAGRMEKSEIIKKIRNFYAKDKGNAIFTQLLSLFHQHNLIP